MANNRPTSNSDGIDIEFTDVSYSVNVWTPGKIFRPEKKKILQNVSGKFLKNQSYAIIGCSGSGKSSLLNFVSGYKTTGYKGSININGKPRRREVFLKRSSYIMQDDHLQPYLTILESMEIASKLRYCVMKLDVYQQVIIKRILENFKLTEKQNTLARNLSGGECRRLSIAMELIRNPKVMFFDEPTTGLDMASANKVVSVLRDLAKSGRTIICTIHQMTASHLNLFDVLYILSPTGQCIYRGQSSQLLNYLSSIGLHCPLHHNPADYVIEVSCGEYGDYIDSLVECADNGKSNSWCEEKQDQSVSEEAVLNENFTVETYRQKRSSRFFHELRVLIRRTMLISSRDSELINIRLFAPVIVACLFGLVYYDIGNNGLYTRDNVTLLYFCVTYIVFLSAYSMSIKFPLDFLLMRLEHFNQWYSIKSYYACLTIMDLPIQITSTGLFCLVLYVMSGQPFELFRFVLFSLMFILTGLLSQATGMLIAILFKSFLMNAIVISLILLPTTMFAGIMLRISDTPKMYTWIYDISMLKHSVQGILHSVYGFKRADMECPEIYCPNRSPSSVLQNFSMSENIFWISAIYITGIFVCLKICTYMVLKKKL
ncbi:ATP-binding cassette sub-family G member 4-like [Adelges cooleyi]|uniref:ATP-binding cassette sub-family G member 4-like n=1 Tax=Adelges cooleyi TaxID=133065 RepID=UPI00217FDC08|nr:ATP-binding cassette sub-family G member 4-like [Adelges cooleyi]